MPWPSGRKGQLFRSVQPVDGKYSSGVSAADSGMRVRSVSRIKAYLACHAVLLDGVLGIHNVKPGM